MKKITSGAVLSSLTLAILLVLLISLAACSSDGTTPPDGSGNGTEPPRFSVENLIISPTDIQPGDTVTISVRVRNRGGTQGDYTVVLRINGTPEAEETVTVRAGGSERAEFSLTRQAEGTYTVTIDDLSGSFTLTLPPAPVAFIADGIITAGEYDRMQEHGSYQIHWKSDGEFIYVAITAQTSGWVAVGFNPTTRMKNADIVLGFVADGQVTVLDMFSPFDFGPHPPDTEQGGTFDILEFGGREENGRTTIEFKRALDTGDELDNVLTQGAIKIIWSYGSTDDIDQRHAVRGEDIIAL